MDYFNRKIMYDDQYLNGFRRKLGSPLIDRTGILNREIQVIDKIPGDLSGAKGFGKTADKRGHNIMAICNQKQRELRVCYSGGIDSTAAMVSILKAKESFPDVEVIAILSKESIRENPKFYYDHIDGELEVWETSGTNLAEVMTKYTNNAFHILTGELGDQIFGSALMFNGDPEKLSQPWYEVFSPKNVDYMLPLMQANPFIQDDDSVANALWWFNFTLKYQWVQERMYVMTGGAVHFNDFLHFFGGDRFQKYALTTPMKKKFEDFSKPATYKMPAKKYIYEFTKDGDYRDNKEKSPSLKNNLDVGISQYLERLDENMNVIKVEKDDETDKVE